jgi:isopentenyldiphosphate isomerase
MTEQNIEVDINDSQIGLRPRDDFYTGKYIHRSSHLILFNSKNEILLQHRTPTKKWYPNLFTYSVSGTVANESYEECIEREMQEEIGISINVKRLFTYPFFDTLDKAWRCVFIGKTDDNIIPDAREIQEIKWMDADELKRDILKNSDIYSPPFVEGMKKYFNEFYGNEKQIRN